MQTAEEKKAYKAKWARQKRAKDPEFRERQRLASAAFNEKLKKKKIYVNLPDITGIKFGKLLVVRRCNSERKTTKWLCECECGKLVEVYRSYLKSGSTKSCGCLKKGINKTHGCSHSKEHRCWSGMKSRCLDVNCSSYSRYGGAGIKICRRWILSFENFVEDMGVAPSPAHSIERINNEGDYEKINCRWATKKEQANNKGNNINITYRKQTKTLKQWSEYFSLDYKKFYYLIVRKKLTIKEALKDGAIFSN